MIKKIAFLVHDFHFGGGGERVVTNLANEFVLNNCRVTIISLCKRKNREMPFKINKNVEIKYLNTDIFPSSILNKLFSIFKVRNFLKNNDFNIILGIGTYLNVLLALSTPNNSSYKTIGCEHSYFFKASFIWKLLRKIFYSRLSALVSLTNNDIVPLSSINKNTYVIPNSCSFFTSQKALLNEKKILALSRISYEKGIDIMVEMFSDFCKVNPDWQLEIYGEGPDKEKIKLLIKEKHLEDRISLFPAIKDVIPVYLSASIYLLTSRFEGLPMVLIEASECGLPLVAYNCKTGPAEIILNGKNGFLIPCYNKQMMVEKLNLLCNDEILRKEMGKKSKEMATRFHKNNILKKWFDLFDSLK